jgi:hypothetical protein
VSPRYSRRRPPDPKAAPRGRRYGWAPVTVTSDLGEDRDVEREVGEMVSVLKERGPMTRRELRRAVESRFWGPGRFADALWLAQRRGLVSRAGGRLVASDGDDR